MQVRRKVRDAVDAQALLDEMERTKLPLAEFARMRGVDSRSLNMYQLNLAASEPKPAPMRLVELVPTKEARYVVRCGNLSVEVDEQFDEQVLRRLLAVVASC